MEVFVLLVKRRTTVEGVVWEGILTGFRRWQLDEGVKFGGLRFWWCGVVRAVGCGGVCGFAVERFLCRLVTVKSIPSTDGCALRVLVVWW
jgi:hypothetical protein